MFVYLLRCLLRWPEVKVPKDTKMPKPKFGFHSGQSGQEWYVVCGVWCMVYGVSVIILDMLMYVYMLDGFW